MNVFLIRHPQPLAAAGVCYGQRDVDIDAASPARAAVAVRASIPHSALERATIFSSPATRCLRLARELAQLRPPTVTSDLREIDFGAWEGLCWDAIPRAELDAWAVDVWGYRPGGAESAELVARRWRRWSAAVVATERVAASAASDNAAADSVVAVTHAGFIRVALHCEDKLDALEFAGARIGYGSVHRIACERRTS